MNCKLSADYERVLMTEVAKQLSKLRKEQGGSKRFAKLSIKDTQSDWYKKALQLKYIELPPMGEKTLAKVTIAGELEIAFSKARN